MKEKSGIIRDTPRDRRLLEKLDASVADKVGNNGLDRNREPFTDEEIAIANRIGTPEQEDSES